MKSEINEIAFGICGVWRKNYFRELSYVELIEFLYVMFKMFLNVLLQKFIDVKVITKA